MRKTFKLQNITGLVALSYLVLIPVGAAILYLKVRDLETDMSKMWDDDFGDSMSERVSLADKTKRFLLNK